MTPLEHYRAAERLLERAEDGSAAQAMNNVLASDALRAQALQCMIAMAQVHATLATVEAHASSHWGGGDLE